MASPPLRFPGGARQSHGGTGRGECRVSMSGDGRGKCRGGGSDSEQRARGPSVASREPQELGR